MKPCASNTMTPTMLKALRAIEAGEDVSAVAGQPTRQRLAKFGLAEFVPIKTLAELTTSRWDRPMQFTEKGKTALAGHPQRGEAQPRATPKATPKDPPCFACRHPKESHLSSGAWPCTYINHAECCDCPKYVER